MQEEEEEEEEEEEKETRVCGSIATLTLKTERKKGGWHVTAYCNDKLLYLNAKNAVAVAECTKVK